MPRHFRISLTISLLLTVLIVICGIVRPLADFYALHLYPVISCVLSWLSSPFGFSLEGVFIFLIVLDFIGIIVHSIHKHLGWGRFLAHEANLVLWTFVWFYSTWCLNYSRSSIYQRTDAAVCQYDSIEFAAFTHDFIEDLNDSYVENQMVTTEHLEREIKGFYSNVPAEYGLCRPRQWQHAKRMMPEWYFTSTGILGYMGPLFSEFHLNSNLLPMQLPFTWAHEYSHLLGISNEAEANWWAWKACSSSSVPEIRYSAYVSILPYVLSNASALLSTEDYHALLESIKPKIIEDVCQKQDYWVEKRSPLLDELQSLVYNLFLKSNGISSGTKNYSEVVQMIMSLE